MRRRPLAGRDRAQAGPSIAGELVGGAVALVAALTDLRTSAAEGLEVVRSSPFRRHQRAHVQRVAEVAEPIHRAVRNARVLARRVAAAIRYDEQVPTTYLDLVDGLAAAAGDLADALAAQRPVADIRPDLERLARGSASAGASTSMSAVVVLAQVRSMVVDLLELTGLDQGEALALVPRPGS